ncbi:hypothetical protein FA13DRAFT_1726014, partial [Coprinellus micaceus]
TLKLIPCGLSSLQNLVVSDAHSIVRECLIRIITFSHVSSLRSLGTKARTMEGTQPDHRDIYLTVAL